MTTSMNGRIINSTLDQIGKTYNLLCSSFIIDGFICTYELPLHSGGPYHYKIYEKEDMCFKLTISFLSVTLEDFYRSKYNA